MEVYTYYLIAISASQFSTFNSNSTHVKGVLFGLSACKALIMNPAVNNCWRNIHDYYYCFIY